MNSDFEVISSLEKKYNCIHTKNVNMLYSDNNTSTKKRGIFVDVLYLHEPDKPTSGSPIRNQLIIAIAFRNIPLDKQDILLLGKLSRLEYIKIYNAGITSLNGFENLYKLKNLDVSGEKKLIDISNLKYLKKLKGLNVSNTSVDSIEAVKDHYNLKMLNAHNSMITSLLPIRNNSKLEKLYVNNTKITDFETIKKFKHLNELELNNLNITDFKFIESLKCLVFLSLSGTNIKDISILKKLVNLRRLILKNTKIKDISMLSSNKEIEYLDISNTKINDISILSSNKKIKYLNISETRVTNYEVLKSLINLESFYGNNLLFRNFDIFKKNINLKEVELRNSKIDDASKLAGYNLKKIDLSYANIDRLDIHKNTQHMGNLIEFNIVSTNIKYADFCSFNFKRTLLNGMKIRNAKFKNTIMRNVDLSNVILQNADFTNADLTNATISNADLKGSLVYNTKLNNTNLSYTNLMNIKGETIEQLSKVSSLNRAILDPELENALSILYPNLFENNVNEEKTDNIDNAEEETFTLNFNKSDYTQEEIAEIISKFSDLYRAIGGDGLEIVGSSTSNRINSEV